MLKALVLILSWFDGRDAGPGFAQTNPGPHCLRRCNYSNYENTEHNRYNWKRDDQS